MAYNTPQASFVYVSTEIDFKVADETIIFTTQPLLLFIPISFILICDEATAATGDAIFNVGWTGPNYDDWIMGNAFSGPQQGFFSQGSSPSSVMPAPSATPVRINITSPDTGTSLSGRLIFTGFYLP